ncbi:hypothetical protein [Sphingobacterium sp. JUb56]|uniref:hypothetical protein n=1 Tax=Sphingobacterium sp. JUb56 TaxID=2587145 RepID=UPI00160AE2B7|nr:hypothetical protein [Sphingobacterium sp. JUb56]MBB2949896.1 hypothetical protein [Sphingobacterium sp. JUb56]
MQFATLTRSILLDLQSKGYNILTSKNRIDDENPTWYPISVPNVWDYLLQLDGKTKVMSFQEPAVLVIEDALLNVEDEQLDGEVFIEDDHYLRLNQRFHIYNQYYQFVANPEVYDFSFDPQRLIIRNYALHTGDHSMYLDYLQLHYPEHVAVGMKDLESLTRSLICLDSTQAHNWFMMHNVAVIESDIWVCDEDAILKVLAVQGDDYRWNISGDTEQLIYNRIAPQDLLPMHDLFWIDSRVRKEI